MLCAVAHVYRCGAAVGAAPTKSVEPTFEVPRATAGRWVALARARGFLGQTEPGKADETKVDQSERHVTFAEYAERWRQSRKRGHSLETRRRVESNIRVHLNPAFGSRVMRSITVTDILEWITACLLGTATGKPCSQSSVGLYFDILKAVMRAAVADKVIPDNPV